MAKCFCNRLHAECDPRGCDRAQAEYPQTTTLEQLSTNGCLTCSLLAHGLKLPEIQRVWQQVGGVWQPDEGKLRLEWTPTTGRTIIRTAGSWDGAYWRHFNFSLDPDAPKSEAGKCPGLSRQPKHPLTYTGSPDAFGWLHRWLQDCDDNHGCVPMEVPTLPERVLAIHSDRVVVEAGAGRPAFYTTLSHCWGAESPLMLTTSNRTELASFGLPLSLLPQTYRDAITITTQLPRDVRYIWIDSLCILQDDMEDWRTEALKMSSVYGKSYLNIAAKHAANAHGGCFAYPKEERPHKAFRIPATNVLVREAPRPDHHDFGVHHQNTMQHPDPLLQRCWVLQERLLAPRVVYYDSDEMLWECKQRHDCQCGAMVTMAGFKDYWASAMSTGERIHMGKEHPITAWLKVLHKYTAMQLTFETDRLIALEGIVQQMRATGSAGDYIAGMWTHRLERQIAWYLQDTFQAPASRMAPSWSWASKRGSVFFGDAGNFTMTEAPKSGAAQIESVTAFEADDPVSGVLRVRSKAVAMTATVTHPSSSEVPATYQLKDSQSGQLVLNVRSDLIDEDDILGRERPLEMLWWGQIWVGWAYFLLLQPASMSGFHERFGQYSFDVAQTDQKSRLATILGHSEERTYDII
ncbi:hypothetical protein LTR36_010979 [Oleoguttula mirabilis]|uniref:Heterokaryon incompatibility domain-containing protein n=1 Tax=Oleoguttula mirabilis TaxID=1507867 RepID=A0AAV9J3A6_9PEZI|nr:hypothetical protein LTR36_010979 [Oleoguttula mirabilis]